MTILIPLIRPEELGWINWAVVGICGENVFDEFVEINWIRMILLWRDQTQNSGKIYSLEVH